LPGKSFIQYPSSRAEGAVIQDRRCASRTGTGLPRRSAPRSNARAQRLAPRDADRTIPVITSRRRGDRGPSRVSGAVLDCRVASLLAV